MIPFEKSLKNSEILFSEINPHEVKALIENLQNTVSVFTLVSFKRVEKEIWEGCCTSGIRSYFVLLHYVKENSEHQNDRKHTNFQESV